MVQCDKDSRKLSYLKNLNEYAIKLLKKVSWVPHDDLPKQIWILLRSVSMQT
jgi:hypothetical protein